MCRVHGLMTSWVNPLSKWIEELGEFWLRTCSDVSCSANSTISRGALGARVWQLCKGELQLPPLHSSGAVKLKHSPPLRPLRELGCGVGADPNRPLAGNLPPQSMSTPFNLQKIEECWSFTKTKTNPKIVNHSTSRPWRYSRWDRHGLAACPITSQPSGR
jgi:hypothetical protein